MAEYSVNMMVMLSKETESQTRFREWEAEQTGQWTRSHTSENCVSAVDLEQVHPFHPSAHFTVCCLTFPQQLEPKRLSKYKLP